MRVVHPSSRSDDLSNANDVTSSFESNAGVMRGV
jgi:hypothetical protein